MPKPMVMQGCWTSPQFTPPFSKMLMCKSGPRTYELENISIPFIPTVLQKFLWSLQMHSVRSWMKHGVKRKFTLLPLKMVLLRTEISYKGHFHIFFPTNSQTGWGFLKECFDLSVRNVPLDFTPYSSDSKILSEMSCIFRQVLQVNLN